MKLRSAAVAAALAIVVGGSADVAAEGPDGVELLLSQLQRVVQSGDPGAYERLLTLSANRANAALFAADQLRPGVTRAVVHERDRVELAGALPGDGYSIAVDLFEERGDQARISTWRLDITRRDAPPGALEWAIGDQAEVSAVNDLHRLSLDPARRFTATNLILRDHDFQLTLADGAVFVAEINAGITALVMLGRGQMLFDPAPAAEKTQLRIFSGADVLDTRFDSAYVRINPADFERLVSTNQLRPAPLDSNEFRKADRIFREESPKSYALELGDLTPDAWSLVPGGGDFIADVHTRRFDTLTYSRFSASREDVSLFDRAARKTIALYSSRRGEAGEGAEAPAYDVGHYDIDVIAAPERYWIDGRTRMTIRVGEQPLQTVTLRLAESLVVQSVISKEYGRLFNMRAKGQSSVIVSLPAMLLPGTEVTLTVSYAGRLNPQQADGETVAVAQVDAAGPRDVDVNDPEPSFLYSNQTSWYPRAPWNHYATATLRIAVPTSYSCIASGEAERSSPVAVPAGPTTPARKTYVFHALWPLRYFSFVISRLNTIRTTPVGGLQLTVQANPGHDSHAREVADRTADIAGFYMSIVDDAPYSSLTVALLESDAPGGHSPGYFAVLNVPPPPLRGFGIRSDPASFREFPDYVLAHEVAHQWWGQAVGWRTYHDQWLSEGFSQYFAALYAQRARGDRVFGQVMRRMRQWALDQSPAGPIALGYRLGHIQGDTRIFRALVYNKSAIVLHMLRQLVGDEAFFSGLRRFYALSRYSSVGTREFRTAMESASGRSLDRFFDGWINGAALPRLTFSYRLDAGAAANTQPAGDLVLRFEQLGDLFELPVTVTLLYADQSSADVVVPVTDRVVEIRVPLRGALRSAAISRELPPLAEVVRN